MALDAKRYWEDRLDADDSLGAVGWVGLGPAFNRWLYAVRRRVFRRVVRGQVELGEDSRVLDVGSGTGFYLGVWRDLGVTRIEGADLTDTATRRLRAAHSDTPIHQFDLGGDPSGLPDGEFDVISAMDVLFHIIDPVAYERAIMNLARLVRPGGQVVLTENLLASAPAVTAHQVSRTEKEILTLLERHGLEPSAKAAMFVLLNSPVDSESRLLRHWWSLLTRVAGASEPLGWLAGASLVPFELAAVRLVRRGPSTKILVCRRTGRP
jgi:SAM-dependent methyltransferase